MTRPLPSLITSGVQGPIADVLLHGHAGITQVSPLDIKEVIS